MESIAKTIQKREESLVKKEQDKEMSPLHLFLSTSLNVEMVYTILEGICRFTLLNYMRSEFSKEQFKKFQKMEYAVDQHGDITITIRRVKIANIEAWEKTSGEEFFRSNSVATPCDSFLTDLSAH